MSVIPLFFFFQAEDGIRDLTVTGVQTCALPICARAEGRLRGGVGVTARRQQPDVEGVAVGGALHLVKRPVVGRSEERRVGKSVDLGGRRSVREKSERGFGEWRVLRSPTCSWRGS